MPTDEEILQPLELPNKKKRVNDTKPTDPSVLFTSILNAGASSFGKAFLLYAVPMIVLRFKLRKTILWRACALAGFMGTAKAVQMIFNHQQNKTLKYYAQAIAGGVGASVALSIDSGLGYNTLVIWFAIRAARCLIEENAIGKFITNIPHMPTIIMCISASQILSCWIRYPKELDSNYRKFLDYQGGRPRWVLARAAAPNFPVKFPFYEIRKPGTTMFTDGVNFFFAGLKRAARLYVPLYIVMFLFGLCQAKNRSPGRISKLFYQFLTNVTRSILFLATYCTMAWTWYPTLGYCIPNPAPKGATRAMLRRNGWISGLATLLERKERRSLLAMYCATYALDSIWRRMEMNSILVKKLQPVIAAVSLITSCSILLHYHNKQPTLVTKWLLGFHSKSYSHQKEDDGNDDEDNEEINFA